MSSKRVFIALDISAKARIVCSAHIEHLRREYKDVRVGWEQPEKLHITLKFLGNTGSRELKALESSMHDVAGRHSPFLLHLLHTGVFPSKRRPHVLWVGFEETSGTILPLHADIEDTCRGLGFKEDGRRFQPHVTIGRIREPEKARRLCELHLATEIEPVEFKLSEIVIYESSLQSTGSVYSPVSRVRLRAA